VPLVLVVTSKQEFSLPTAIWMEIIRKGQVLVSDLVLSIMHVKGWKIRMRISVCGDHILGENMKLIQKHFSTAQE
jgi:hypothetical protein